MASLNKVQIIGNLGNDPETKFTQSGTAVTNISVATTRKFKDRDDQVQEETEWHRVTFWGKLAEIAGEYLRKGASVYVEGRLKTEKWTDQNGVDRYTTKIIADEMVMLGGRRDGDSGGQAQRQERPQQQRQPQQQAPQQGGFADDFADDTIPF
jgi:single-strand DNA-binding protein